MKHIDRSSSGVKRYFENLRQEARTDSKKAKTQGGGLSTTGSYFQSIKAKPTPSTKEKISFYQKTDIPKPGLGAARGPTLINNMFNWSGQFLNMLAKEFGIEWLVGYLACFLECVSLLPLLCNHILTSTKCMIAKANKLSNVDWLMTSHFSGVGCAEFAALSLQHAANVFLKKNGFKGSFAVDCGPACEWNQACQKVLAATFPGKCVFGDVCKLPTSSGTTSFCTTHQQQCHVGHKQQAKGKQLHINVSGPPCVAWSRMGKQNGKNHECWSAHCAWMRQRKQSTSWVTILENVTEYSIDLIRDSFPPPQYEIKHVKLDPRLFGIPASRARLYAVILDTRYVVWSSDDSLNQWVRKLCSSVVMSADVFWFKDLPRDNLSAASNNNLNDYMRSSKFKGKKIFDLHQIVANNRGRAECQDGGLMTLTTNSGSLFHKAWVSNVY